MKLLKDIWEHLKEWSDWGMKDWIKAGIVAIIVLFVLKSLLAPGVQFGVKFIIKALARCCRASGIWICRDKEGFDAKTSLGKVNIRLRKGETNVPRNINNQQKGK